MTIETMWGVLCQHQPDANKHGYGQQWLAMCQRQDFDSAMNAARASWAKSKHVAKACVNAAHACLAVNESQLNWAITLCMKDMK